MRKISAFILLSLLFASGAWAQKGQMIQAVGGVQYTRMANSNDIRNMLQGSAIERIELVDTYRPTFGFEYVNNFDSSFGFQTGLLFSGNGQRYKGYNSYDANALNPGDTLKARDLDWTSSIELNYLKIPLLFRFNSNLDGNEVVYMSIGVGFYTSILMNVANVKTSPAPPAYLLNNPPNYRKMFNTFDYGYMFNAQINVNVSRRWGLAVGGRFDRSFTDAENKRFFTAMTPEEYRAFTATHAAEDIFPVSTKKPSHLGRDDYFTRDPTKNSTVSGYLGVYYRF